MMSTDINVPEEYINSLCERLYEWSTLDDSMIFPQFLAGHNIGWAYFEKLLDISPELHVTFEAALSRICSRWLEIAFAKDVNPLMQKLAMYYIQLYDGHSFSAQKSIRKEDNKTIQIGVDNYNLREFSEKQSVEVLSKVTKQIKNN